MTVDVDTIAAVSTAPGLAALAVVRLSGPGAFGVLRRLLDSETPGAPPPRRSTLCELRDPEGGEVLDHALVTRYERPDSYTGEDVVEISCHGGWLVPALVLDACLRAGARRAEAGEFTRRAYLHGKLDLLQAEAVADVIESRSRAHHRAALGQLEKGLSSRIDALREALVRLEARLVHHVDFPEEDDAPIPLEVLRGEAEGVRAMMATLIATAPEGVLLREGALTVLAGRANVGKSSLYNALLGEERAIVTNEPGTTRDALEAVVQMGGFPFRLVDTAGLREGAGEVERLGVQVATRYLDNADLVLYCVEAGSALTGAEREFLESEGNAPVVLVETKSDLARDGQRGGADPPKGTHGSFDPRIAAHGRVSAVTGDGLAELRTLLPEIVFSGLVQTRGAAPVLTRRRHERCMREAEAAVAAFGTALDDGVSVELAWPHLHAATDALEDVLGVVSLDDVLDAVFSEFCVGK